MGDGELISRGWDVPGLPHEYKLLLPTESSHQHPKLHFPKIFIRSEVTHRMNENIYNCISVKEPLTRVKEEFS